MLVEVTRRRLFASGILEIGRFEARPKSDSCVEGELQASPVVVLPVSGVFARHDGPGRHVIGSASHAIFIAAETPYRISFPGAIGDRALTLRFSCDVIDADRESGGDCVNLVSHGLLPAQALVLRNLLWRRLDGGTVDAFAAEASGLDLLALSLGAMRRGDAAPRRSAQRRRMRAVERVREAVALAASDTWTVAALAEVAGLSPFYLCRVFRREVGTSLYD